MFETVNYSLDDGIAIISLNRPDRLNAINAALLRDFQAALRCANGDEAVRTILLQGEGRAFCAGDDLKEFGDQSRNRSQATAYIESIQDVTRAMVLNDKIVIGSIHGWAAGGGFEWVINCDLVVAAEGTRFFFPEVSLGIMVTGGVTALLPRMIGVERTKRLILLGEKIDTTEAKELGFDWTVVPAEERVPRAREVAHRIAGLPQAPVRQLKRILNIAPYAGLETALGLETAAAVDGFLDPDSEERAGKAIASG